MPRQRLYCWYVFVNTLYGRGWKYVDLCLSKACDFDRR